MEYNLTAEEACQLLNKGIDDFNINYLPIYGVVLTPSKKVEPVDLKILVSNGRLSAKTEGTVNTYCLEEVMNLKEEMRETAYKLFKKKRRRFFLIPMGIFLAVMAVIVAFMLLS